MTKENTTNNSSNESSLTSSYPPPKNVKKIPKGDKGFALVKKAFGKGLKENVKDFQSWFEEESKNNSSENGRE